MKMQELVVDMARTVREHVASKIGPLLAQIAELEKKMATIEKRSAARIRALEKQLAEMERTVIRRGPDGRFR